MISVSDPSHFDVDSDPDPEIHIWEKWIRILDPPFRDSGSGSSDPHLEKVDPDPVPKKFMSDKLKCLFLLPPKFRKGISHITKTFSFTYYSK